MSEKLKQLQVDIAAFFDHPRGSSRMVRAKRVLNVMNNHLEELSIKSFQIGRETDDIFELERQLKTDGLLPRSCDLNSRFEKILSRYE